jgi:hypothetical protein
MVGSGFREPSGSLLLLPERTESMNYGRRQATGKGREGKGRAVLKFPSSVSTRDGCFLFLSFSPSLSLSPSLSVVVELQPCSPCTQAHTVFSLRRTKELINNFNIFCEIMLLGKCPDEFVLVT